MSRSFQQNQQNQNSNNSSNMNTRQTGPNNLNAKEKKLEYNLPGVLHFLQAEYRNFERERNEQSIQIAELKAKVVSLEGEKRAVEGIKNDLLRRVKMLEYALRQERGKYLSKEQKSDSDKPNSSAQPSSIEEAKDLQQVNLLKKAATSRPNSLNSQKNKFRKDKCREVLKMCLVELNTMPLPTDLPPRSNRSSFDQGDEALSSSSNKAVHNFSATESEVNLNPVKREARQHQNGHKPSLSIYIANNSSFSDSSMHSPIPISLKDNFTTTNSSKPNPPEQKQQDGATENKPIPRPKSNLSSNLLDEEKRKNRITVIAPDNYQGELLEDMAHLSSSPFSGGNSVSSKSGKSLKEKVNEVAKEMNHKDITNASLSRASANRLGSLFKALGREQDDDTTDYSSEIGFSNPEATLLGTKGIREEFNFGSSMQNLSLDLADLQKGMQEPISSQSPAADSFTDQSNMNIWKPKLTLKSHLDSVRALKFHPTDMVLASGSEDGTVKLWKLQSLNNLTKKSLRQDFEPWFIYRGHSSCVTSVELSAQHSCLFSSGFDFTIKRWKFPESERIVQDPTEPKLLERTLVGHTDIVWNLKLSPLASQANTKEKVWLASTSADGSTKLWDTDPTNQSPLTSTITYTNLLDSLPNGIGKDIVPTSVDFLHSDSSKLLIAYRNSTIQLVDINTNKVITQYKSDETYDGTAATQINSIVSHPTIPLVVSGHEDRYIRFFDVNSGLCAHSMVAHLDSISSLDINSAGLSLVSGGHDASIRWWDLTTYACVQEFSSHRSKSDEAVYSLQFHPSLPWLASSGADSAIKLFNI